MEVILSRLCKSFTGTISKRHGYAVRQREERYYGVRNNRGYVPPEGHLLFIYDCAGIAEEGLLFSDIRVTGAELIEAAEEAGIQLESVMPDVEYNAHDVLNIWQYESIHP